VSVRAVVLADTHIRSGGRRQLPEAAYRILATADVILHAGDVLDEGVLTGLATVAPTYAVLGNNDLGLAGVLPPARVVDLGGVEVAMVHDSGAAAGRAARLRRRFPTAQVVVFGHSHLPLDTEGVDGQRLFNPGSPTERRASPHHTVGILELADGEVRDHRIVIV
jgi:putative phosphoesterase